MNLINKALCLLLFGFLVVEIFPQGVSYISANGKINNSFLTRSIYDISTFTPLKNKSAGVLDSLICKFLSGDRIKIEYSYNNDLSLNYFTDAVWFNDEWIYSEKHTNKYNSEGKLISVLGESFNSTANEWHQTEKDTYSYDSLGNRIFSLHQFFNGQEFVNAFKYENYYDTANNLVSSVNQDWADSIWVNRFKYVYTYTLENVNDTTLFQVWTNDQWVNYYLTNYEYDENYNMIAILTKIWQETQWIDYALGIFEYDVNNNLVLDYWQIAENNNWENWFKIFYKYDENNNLIHLFGEEWENGQWVPENEPLKVTNPDGILYGYLAKEIFLYYSPPTRVKSEKNIADGYNLLQNYPNPFNPGTKIRYSILCAGAQCVVPVQIKVYDVLGNEIATLVDEEKSAGSYEVIWDAGNLSSGVYFYKLQLGAFVETKKMLLLR